MASSKLEKLSHLATIIAAVVAAITFYFAYLQFRDTQQATRDTLQLQRESIDFEKESKAVEMFIKYNEIMKESKGSPDQNVNKTDFWRDNLSISIAETIFKLRGDDPGWRDTVIWMISHHINFLKERGLGCSTFTKEFVILVNQEVKQDVCKK